MELDNITLTEQELKAIDIIKTEWTKLKPSYNDSIIEADPSVISPYKLGKVHQESLLDALNMTNFVRFLAHLPTNITLNNQYNQDAQAAALVNAANQKMTHYPVKPNMMNDTLFQQGYDAASSSNIAYGYKTLTSSIQDGYMSDASLSNRNTVGHRRWILSPRLNEIGFGYVIATDGVPHSAMKVMFDGMWKSPELDYQQINWPGETVFPIEFFSMQDPWSVSLNSKLYDQTKTKDILVELTRLNDHKQWIFHNESTKDGFFNINKDNYGYTPFTIIFQPNQDASYRKGDQYEVKISGLYTKNGEKTTYSYETTFFNLK